MRLPVNRVLPLAALALLNGCIFGGGGQVASLAPPANGPAADYPVVIGAPFTVDDVTHTPADQLNYDAVGYASVSPQDGAAISAAHKTLPLPSYVEVTSLESGKTILLRLESRGPMTNERLVELSPAAAVQLGFAGGEKTPVRVRRVNPPEQERALLRAGKPAPERMETPEPLLKVLNRKLAENSAPAVRLPPAPALAAAGADSAPDEEPAPAKAPEVAASPAAVAAASQPDGGNSARDGLVVQVAAFSSQQRADGVAQKLGASVSKPGSYWIVRLGPYGSQGDASKGLAKARAAGYSDARIQRVN